MMKAYEISATAKPPKGRFPSYADLGMKEGDVKYTRPIGLGRPFPRNWKPIQFYIRTPRLPRPNFFGFGGGALVCDARAAELAGEALEMSGELLPVTIEDEDGDFFIFNATNCINVLDKEKSTWRQLDAKGEYKELQSLEFLPARFGEESIFKFPEEGAIGIYCLERTGDANEGEFKAVVEKHALTGLEFKLVWSDEK